MDTTTHHDDDNRLAQLELENASFREQLRTLDVQLQERDQKIESLEQEVAGWKKAYDDLLQSTFRKRSEQYIDDPTQLRLDFGNTDEAADAADGLADAVEELEQTIPEHQRRRPRKKRDESLPAHLPREEVVADVPLDNNETEQLMKQVAIGRKNWLFAGSVKGGERTGGLLTLVSSAIRNDLDVWSYIKDVLDQLLAGSTEYEALLPWNWRKEHPESVREHRIAERKERTDRKRERRARRRALKRGVRTGST